MDGINRVLMVLIGGVAGLLAGRITRTRQGVAGNVVLGVPGATGMNAVLRSAFGVHVGSFIGQFVTAMLGAAGIFLVFQFIRDNRG